MYVAQHGHLGVTKELLRRDRIDVNFVTLKGWPALMYAAESGHLEVAKELLGDHRIDVNISTAKGWTASCTLPNMGI